MTSVIVFSGINFCVMLSDRQVVRMFNNRIIESELECKVVEGDLGYVTGLGRARKLNQLKFAFCNFDHAKGDFNEYLSSVNDAFNDDSIDDTSLIYTYRARSDGGIITRARRFNTHAGSFAELKRDAFNVYAPCVNAVVSDLLKSDLAGLLNEDNVQDINVFERDCLQPMIMANTQLSINSNGLVSQDCDVAILLADGSKYSKHYPSGIYL